MPQKNRGLMRSMARLSEANSAISDLQLALERMAGINDNSYAFRTLSFSPKAVGVIGGDLNLRVKAKWSDGVSGYVVYRRPTTYDEQMQKWVSFMTANDQADEILQTEDCEYILAPAFDEEVTGGISDLNDLRTKYVIPIPYDVTPQVILTPKGYWVQGIDFITTLGALITPHDPNLAFPNGKITCQMLQRRSSSWFDYIWQVDNVTSSGIFIANYYRNTQNPGAFASAIAEACGLQVLPWDATLLEVDTFCRFRYYRFDQGLLITDYPHDPMEAGLFYRKGTVIGDAVKVYSRPQGATWTWFRQLDWSAGLSLDGITPFSGLVAPDRPCRTYANGQTGGNIHAAITLDGDEQVQTKFWNHVGNAEIISGNYLNTVIGLSGPNDVKYVNPVDIYWQYLLSDRALIIELKTAVMGDYWDKRARAFIEREKPCGSLVIYR